MNNANCITCRKNKSPTTTIAELKLNQHSIKLTKMFEIKCKPRLLSRTRTFNFPYGRIVHGRCDFYNQNQE